MHVGVISLFPKMFEAITDYGVTGRAVARQQLTLNYWNPRDYSQDKHQSVDDRPYGGGPGMVLKVAPLLGAIQAAKQKLGEQSKVIYLSPQGQQLDQAALQQLASNQTLIMLAGRYEGIDERLIEQEVDEEWSIGDYVLSGGELAAMVMIDGLARLLPGVLGDEESAQQDSFSSGLLDCPHYTRPEFIIEKEVPSVLMTGDHKAIKEWRLKQSLGRTWLRRPELLEKLTLDSEKTRLLEQFIAEWQQQSE